MTADQLIKALTWCGKPLSPERLRKAEQRADSPAVWAEVLERLAANASRAKIVEECE